ncbi:hypothetical protein C7Y72_08530 [Paraconexibacter algicola]|uniref:Uncharacterized protein n=1 Tax=Paraconexibacter algicola TaxID=2133960 RepID=A0A2T4UKA8_9ACTN|nr:hypothetical protein C7Y72_08530 [Paraconexibacter algicola]
MASVSALRCAAGSPSRTRRYGRPITALTTSTRATPSAVARTSARPGRGRASGAVRHQAAASTAAPPARTTRNGSPRLKPIDTCHATVAHPATTMRGRRAR